nr:hypothetical protein [Tanacetum cinerariifolium]
MEIDGADHGLQ